MGDKPSLGQEAGQHEHLVGGVVGEYRLPLMYAVTACGIWWLAVTLVGGLVLAARPWWYGAVWGVIGAGFVVSSLVAVGADPEVHPFWGGAVGLLCLVAAWLWDQDGRALVASPLPWRDLLLIYGGIVVLGWLFSLGLLWFSFGAQTVDRNWVPTRDKLPGEWGPMWPWLWGRMFLPAGRYGEEEPPVVAPPAAEPVHVVSVGYVDMEPHMQEVAHGVQRSNGLGGSGRMGTLEATPSQFEEVRRVLLDASGDLRNGGKLQPDELGGSRVFSTEDFRAFRRAMVEVGFAERESEHPKAAYVLTEAGRRFLDERGWQA